MFDKTKITDVKDDDGLTPDERKDKEIVQEAYDNFKDAKDWETPFQTLYVIDTKFANADSDNGWQWPDDLRTDRQINKRPSLTINKVRTKVDLISNEGAQNEVSIQVSPTGKESSFESAEIYEGLIRHIESSSGALSIYQDAYVSAIEGGIGYWRVITEYEDEETFNQTLRIAPVIDQMGVYLDPNIKKKDGSDAKYGFVFDEVPRKQFDKQYPDLHLPAETGLGETEMWIREDYVRVAEYYRIVETKNELIFMVDEQGNAATFKRSDIPAKYRKQVEQDEKNGMEVKKRTVWDKQLEWYKIAGSKITDRRKLKGKYIPIVRCVGIERVIEGKLERKGHVRALKDPQRMYNYNSPLALNTPLPTPSGWTTMGKVEAGDWLLDEKGKPVRVAGTSPVFLRRKCYRVNFDDGSHIIADKQHLWSVEQRGMREAKTWNWFDRTVTTDKLTPKKDFIYATKPINLPDADLPVHPYILGAWLGDGSSRDGGITCHVGDVDEMRAVIAECGFATGEPYVHPAGSAATMTILGLRGRLAALGVLGNKHIPQTYLRASHSQREMLLRGLMDTDGHITKIKQCIFINTRETIARGFAELVRTLGIKANFRMVEGKARAFPGGNISECQDSWRFAFSVPDDVQVFRLTRKAAKQSAPRKSFDRHTKRYKIASVVEVPSVPVKCVVINSDSHLFLAGLGMVPTHNSGQVEFGALATKSPWVGPKKAFEGNEAAWNNANRSNAAYLTYNDWDPERGDNGQSIEKPARPEPPGASPAFLNGMQVAEKEMDMASGQYQATEGKPGNERSGKAINARTTQGDTATFTYPYNRSLAIAHTGNILLDLIPYIYDTERIIQILGRDGIETTVTVDPKADQALSLKKEQDKVQAIFNPRVGKYQVKADVGPAYATQRQEAWNAFVQIVTGAPELINDIGDLMFKSADFPLADEIAERLRRKMRAATPWLFDDNADTPAIQKLKQDLETATKQVAELLEQLADTKRKLSAKDQRRDIESYRAETSRVKDLANSVEDLMHQPGAAALLTASIVQTLRQMGTEDITDTVDAAQMEKAGRKEMDAEPETLTAEPESQEEPPHEGARKAPDGNWYVSDENRPGKFLMVKKGNE